VTIRFSSITVEDYKDTMQTNQTLRTLQDVPLITDFPADYATTQGPFLADMYAKHGPIFRGNIFGNEWVFMVGPEANRFVLSSSRLKFSHYQGWGIAMGVAFMLGNGLLTMDGAEHDQHHKTMNPAFTIAYMDRYLPLMNRIIRERTADWVARGTVDVYIEARKIAFDVAAEALMGLHVGADVDTFRDVFLQLMNLDAVAVDYGDYGRRQEALSGQLTQMMLPRLAERRAAPTDDLLSMMIQARDDSGKGMADAQIIAHSNILLLAGHETSTTLISWLLYLLVEHQDYLQRVLDEQAALLAPDAEPTLDAIKRMRVLDNALSEAERLYPPVSFGPRGVVEDFEFNGYVIPAGTMVNYSIAASHRIGSIFHDPEKFDPDRFAPPREEDKTPYALVGFGGGPRVCIGMNFATVEMKALVSHIVRHYQLAITPGQQLINGGGVVTAPLNGIKMNVTART